MVIPGLLTCLFLFSSESMYLVLNDAPPMATGRVRDIPLHFKVSSPTLYSAIFFGLCRWCWLLLLVLLICFSCWLVFRCWIDFGFPSWLTFHRLACVRELGKRADGFHPMVCHLLYACFSFLFPLVKKTSGQKSPVVVFFVIPWQRWKAKNQWKEREKNVKEKK